MKNAGEIFAVMVAKNSSRGELIDSVKRDMEQYDTEQTEENFAKLSIACQILAMKLLTERTSLDELIKRVDRLKRGDALLDPNKHQS